MLRYCINFSRISQLALKAPEHVVELFFLLVLSVAIKHESLWGSLVTFGTALICYFLFFLLFDRRKSFLATFFTLVGISISSFVKTELLGIPLQLYDFKMVTQLLNVDGLSDFSQFLEVHEVRLTILYSVITLIAYILLSWKNSSIKRFSAWGLLLPFLGVGTICFAMNNIEADKYSQMNNLGRHGAFGIIYSQLYKSMYMAPEGYSESIKKKFSIKNSEEIPNATCPNIVLLLLESTIDPSQLKKIKMSPYPTPFLEEMKGKSLYGRLKVPGGTANAEYEVLTSLPISSLPASCVPYMEISRKTPSLLRFLSKLGYQPFAYHMGNGGFYNRDTVFEAMGFGKYYSKKDFPNKKLYVKNFYRDSTMFEGIFKKLSESEFPVFAHALTIIPHHPYDESKSEFSFRVVSENSDQENERLANYFSRLRHTQNELSAFFAELEKLPRRTLVLMYSDHLPPLSSITSEGGASLFYLLYDTKGQLPRGKNSDLATYELATFLLETAKFPQRAIDSIVREKNQADKLRLIHFDMLYGNQYLTDLYN